MEYDVLVVGGGPAGLAAAIRAKQVALDQGNEDFTVCLIEKGSEIGSHILSGNVFEPTALKELYPMWRGRALKDATEEEKESGVSASYSPSQPHDPDPSIFAELNEILNTPVTQDSFYFMPNSSASIKLPNFLLPKEQHNDQGNYVISLGQLCRWLAERAEELGVDVYPGFAGDELVLDGDVVKGVQLKDVGVSKEGVKKEGMFEPGMRLLGRQTVLSEGCRGSLSLKAIEKFGLDKESCPQHYGFGIKEVWEIDTSQPDHNHSPGLVSHSVGWPVDMATYGGSFLYHQAPNLVHIGYVIGLDYRNPHISPYAEFQRFKHHPNIAKMLKHGTCTQYGARCLNEGGLQAVPKLTFPGGVLAGCAAGFLNVPKIKGSHTALKTGMLAGEEIAKALLSDESGSSEVSSYQSAYESSWVQKELHVVRNCQPSFKKFGGLLGGLSYSGFALHITRGKEPWTFTWTKRDWEYTGKAKDFEPIEYPKPDGKLSFDILDNLIRSNVNHEHDQEAHLRVKEEEVETPLNFSWKEYDGPEGRFCPAKVYEYVDDGSGGKKLQINAQNCVHCKCCSIKTPREYIRWTVPEGGGGPQYAGM